MARVLWEKTEENECGIRCMFTAEANEARRTTPRDGITAEVSAFSIA